MNNYYITKHGIPINKILPLVFYKHHYLCKDVINYIYNIIFSMLKDEFINEPIISSVMEFITTKTTSITIEFNRLEQISHHFAGLSNKIIRKNLYQIVNGLQKAYGNSDEILKVLYYETKKKLLCKSKCQPKKYEKPETKHLKILRYANRDDLLTNYKNYKNINNDKLIFNVDSHVNNNSENYDFVNNIFSIFNTFMIIGLIYFISS